MPGIGAAARNEGDRRKARAIQEMFGSIARRYDLLNHVLSANIDKRWRRVCVYEVLRRLPHRQIRVLDIGCGTADLSIAFARAGKVVGCDFSQPMLRIGIQKIVDAGLAAQASLAGADALSLPFRDDLFDVVASAFVVRNLADLRAALLEMHRVLKPRGVLAILEFSMPSTPLLREIYRFYFMRVLPKLGQWISGVEGPYQYLSESVRSFPAPQTLLQWIGEAGFENVGFRALSGGIAVLFLAEKNS